MNKIKLSNLDKWVMEYREAAEKTEYSNGWWDSVEFLRKVQNDFTDIKITVTDSYQMKTPPPSQFIPMPIIKINIEDITIYLKENWFCEPFWAFSYSESINNPIDFKGFILKINSKQSWLIKDMPGKYLFDDYKPGATKFTGCVKNNFLLYGTFQIIKHHLFNKIRRYKDGISFFSFDINWDRYIADHSPCFEVNLMLLSWIIFELNIYNIHHVGSFE